MFFFNCSRKCNAAGAPNEHWHWQVASPCTPQLEITLERGNVEMWRTAANNIAAQQNFHVLSTTSTASFASAAPFLLLGQLRSLPLPIRSYEFVGIWWPVSCC